MIKVSTALEELIQGNNFLEFGLSEGLLNLTATAEWLKPLLESRIKKNLSRSAILMALSRLTMQKKDNKPGLQSFKLDGITVKTGLTELTYSSTPTNRQDILKFMSNLSQQVPHMTSNFGTREITTLLPENFSQSLKKIVADTPHFEKSGLAALCIEFNPTYVQNPYLLYYLIQQITLQNINIWEISSTYTEVIFYLMEKDIKLAFDTIYLQFKA